MFEKSSGRPDGAGGAYAEDGSLLRLRDVIARAGGTTPGVLAEEPTDDADVLHRDDTEAPSRDEVQKSARDTAVSPPGAPEASPHGDTAAPTRGGRAVRRWVPAGAAGVLARHGRRRIGVLAFGTAAVVALVTIGYLLFSGPSEQRPAAKPQLPVADMSESAVTTTATSTTPDKVVVSVVGHVADPGVVTLSADARVADALEAAGGVDEPSGRRSVNLARHIDDGEQLYVGVSAPASASRPSNAAGSDSSETVNLNTAELTGLQELPHVGEVTAQRIIDWREEHDRFQDVDQLRQVNGIGSKTFAELRDLVRVE